MQIVSRPFRLFLFCLLATFLASPLRAQTAPPPQEKVDQLIRLLSDPDVKAWLASRSADGATPANADDTSMVVPAMIASSIDRIGDHLRALIQAGPAVPEQFERAWGRLRQEFAKAGLAGVFLLIAAFAAAGLGLEWLVRWRTGPFRRWAIGQPSNTPQARLRSLAARLGYSTILMSAFILGSVGAFLAFRWPPLLKEIVVGYLMIVIVTRAAMITCRAFLLPPGLGYPDALALRAVPMSDARARHWCFWIPVNIFWLVFCLVNFALLSSFGFDHMARQVLSVGTGFIQFLLLVLAVWLRPRLDAAELKPSRIGHRGRSWLLTGYFALLLVLHTAAAWKLYWLAIAAVALPATIVLARRGVHYVLRPPQAESGAQPIAPVLVAVIERGIRMGLILAAAGFLAWAWEIDVAGMTAGDTLANRILRGLLNAAIIVLAADFIWSIVRAVISRRLGGLPSSEAVEQAPREARLRTLLPIFQNMLFATIIVIAILMALSSLGVEIGPLIAGAGVVGVAVGFGSQTLVKDIIAGIFYLLDDAFRVGEYIQSGQYMGTIEGFSLRSVRMRHQRGYLYTIPFGELGAVQNMSRDYVVDKFSINVDYATDLEKARKIIKKIGLQLAEDPEYAPYIIEPLKQQGVQNFGDYGIELRLKMRTKPGQQMAIRRKAYVAIKRAFDEAGIQFSSPNINVRGGNAAASGAAAAAALQAQARAAQAATE